MPVAPDEIGLDFAVEAFKYIQKKPNESPPDTLPHTVSKWQARSALQKAVRRGDVGQAKACAALLHEEDVSYFWRALHIIAMEDVGFTHASELLLTAYCATAKRKVIFGDQETERLAAPAIAAHLCSLKKSRALCEMSIHVEYGNKPLLYTIAASGMIGAFDALASRDPFKMHGALLLLRKRAPQGIMLHDMGSTDVKPKVFAFFDSLFTSELEAACAKVLFDKSLDTMSFAFAPVVSEIRRRQDPLAVIKESDPKDRGELIGGLLPATFDMHVMEGKLAIKAFYTSSKKHFPRLAVIENDKAIKALGAALFVEEGSIVDQRWSTPFLDDLKDKQDIALCKAYGVPDQLYVGVRALMKNNLAVMNQKRQWALSVR